MCPSLQGDETPRYLCKCFFHRFRCRGHFLFQNDFPRFIQNAVARPLIAEVQTNRELLPFENHVSIYPNNASLLHSRSPFLLRHERVEHWERIASRGRPAFSSHLVNAVIAEAHPLADWGAGSLFPAFFFLYQQMIGAAAAVRTADCPNIGD